jgi:hypothetical protein
LTHLCWHRSLHSNQISIVTDGIFAGLTSLATLCVRAFCGRTNSCTTTLCFDASVGHLVAALLRFFFFFLAFVRWLRQRYSTQILASQQNQRCHRRGFSRTGRASDSVRSLSGTGVADGHGCHSTQSVLVFVEYCALPSVIRCTVFNSPALPSNALRRAPGACFPSQSCRS